MNIDEDDLVPVHVPRSRLAEVYRLLSTAEPERSAARERERTKGSSADDPTDLHDQDQFEWTIEQLARVSEDPRKSVSVARQVLDLLADTPDELFTFKEIAKATGHSDAELQGALSGFGRIASKINPAGPPWWTYRAVLDDDGRANESTYLLRTTAAERWRRLR